jgi:hypothetical protein
MTIRTKAIASLSGVFLLGALCGALVLGIIVRNRAIETERMREREGFEMFVVERLKLTEAQRDSLKDELEQTFAELDELRFTTANEYRALLDTLKQRISPQLNPEQRQMLSDMDLNFRRGFPGKRHGPPPHPPLGFGPPPEDRPMMNPVTPSTVVPGDTAKHSTGTTTTEAVKSEKHNQSGETPANNTLENTSEGSGTNKPVLPTSRDSAGVSARFAEQVRDAVVLNDAQFQQVRTIVVETRGRIANAQKEFASDPWNARKARNSSLREMNRRIVVLLNDEQRKKYRDFVESILPPKK